MENEEIISRYCPACKSPLIKTTKKIKGIDKLEVEIWICSKGEMPSCLTKD